MKWLIDEKGRKYFLDIKGHEGKIYRPKLDWFPIRNHGPWFTRKPVLHLLVQWIITYSVIYPKLFSRNGKFKKGDRVKYNWMAFIQIYHTDDRMHKIRIVEDVLFTSKSNLKFTNGDSCACFWVRKTFFWE